ncbi:MAG: FkbM family methyltransferase, partial [Chloroflexi bacterium]|nr:FkbM family methyltransferase [Chloroflexota bacterium]
MTHPLLALAAFAARVLPMPVKRAIYRLGPLARAVRGGLNRAAPHGLAEVTVAGGGLAGLRLQLDMQKEKDYWLGTYEPELQAALRDLARPGMTAYDVGAHIGYISLLLARAVSPSGRVFAFEPLPANLERLQANLTLNPDIRNVTV